MNRCRKPAAGLTLVEFLLVIACVAILAAMVLSRPSLPPEKRINCVNNLKQIGLAFKTWALDNDGNYPARVSVTNGGSMEFVESGLVYPHFEVMSNELSTPKLLVCPEDSGRPAATNFAPDFRDGNLSYFMGVDATATTPYALLSGDRNLAIGSVPAVGLLRLPTNNTVRWTRQIHRVDGHILFGDGSVGSRTTAELGMALQNAGSATNRLAIPR